MTLPLKLTLLIAAIGGMAKAQYIQLQPTKPFVNPNYRYLILVKEVVNIQVYDGNNSFFRPEYATKDYLFPTEKDMSHFMSSVEEKNIIAIYDLQTAKQLQPVYTKKHAITPRRVIIEKDERDEITVTFNPPRRR